LVSAFTGASSGPAALRAVVRRSEVFLARPDVALGRAFPFIAEQIDYVRVEACDTCLTKDGFAVPEVDEIATVSLNLWAG